MSDSGWTAADTKILKDLADPGWSILYVADDPPFAYTIGLFGNFRQPELIVFGLSYENSVTICNEYGVAVKAGGTFEQRTRTQRFFENMDDMLVPIEDRHLEAHCGTGLFFYKQRRFPVVQMVRTDQQRRFPWEPTFGGQINRQKLLFDDIPA